MKSITYWNRLEPRPRGREVLESLQARVRDPLWFLTRQFQIGRVPGRGRGVAGLGADGVSRVAVHRVGAAWRRRAK